MTNIDYSRCFGTLMILLTTNQVYGVTSLASLGPSVGHRPVINGLILSTGSGDITQNTTSLTVGDTIRRTAGTISDVDDDPVEAGEYCVWYRVDPNTLVETLVKDPGAGDRNCEYTLQVADLGFRIKNVMKIFSDSAIAHDFTVNPADSWPVESISANQVEPAAQPFPASTTLNTHVHPRTFSLTSGFPSTGFVGAEFTIQVNGSTGNNSQYNWRTNQPSWVSVSSSGVVKFVAQPSSAAKKARIYAASKLDTSILYYIDININDWFTNNNANKGSWISADTYCRNLGSGYGIPTREKLGIRGGYMTFASRTGLGLWAEWGRMDYYSNSWIPHEQYWTADVEGPAAGGGSFMWSARLSDGYIYKGGPNSSFNYYRVCSLTL
ncbi:hypothetical protein CUK74_12590 [Salmonella enterica]|nr:hypothetical protein [Salmonella enterica]